MKKTDSQVIEQYTSFNLQINYCGYDLDSSKCHTNHPLNYYMLLYIFSGEGAIKLNNNTYRIKKNDLIIIPPNTWFTTIPDENMVFKHYYLTFSGNNTELLLKKTLFSTNNMVLHIDNNSVFNDFKSILKLIKNRSFLSIMKANNLLFHIFIALFAQKKENSICEKSQTEYYLKEAFNYIELNYMNNINIQDIAKHLFLNRTYFAQIFKQSTNITLKAYLTNFRLEKAFFLLKNSSLSINEIIQKCGYTETTTFYRQFKAKYGTSPKQAQKNWQLIYNWSIAEHKKTTD